MLTAAARRRVFGEYQATEPSRFLEEIPPDLVEQEFASYTSPYAATRGGWDYRPNPYGRGQRRRGPHVREDANPARGREAFDYSQEPEIVPASLAPGRKVRHGLFGLGTVMSVEPLDDDTKLVVRFASVGTKTLRAKYANLQPA